MNSPSLGLVRQYSNLHAVQLMETEMEPDETWGRNDQDHWGLLNREQQFRFRSPVGAALCNGDADGPLVYKRNNGKVIQLKDKFTLSPSI